MIVVEERINEILSQMPLVDDKRPVYAWGDLYHLNKWVERKPDTYPLIYQTSKKEIQDTAHRRVTTKWEAVIATQNLNKDLFNDERWALSFRNVLNPIAERIKEGFNKCGFVNWDGKVEIERFGNYGDNNQHFTVDIWDAISFKATIEISLFKANDILWQQK